MSFWSRLWPWGRKNATLELFRELFGANLSKSGEPVNWATAIKVSTVLACARVRAQGLAQVPLKIFRQEGDSKTPALDHPLYFLLHSRPNQWQTSYEYRETLSLHLDLAGRHYSLITRGVGNAITELLPFPPGVVDTKRGSDGTITYKVTLDNGQQIELAEDQVWHIRGPSWNGWQGMDAMELTREAIGLAISAEAQHARLFKNGVQTSGTYSVEGILTEPQHTMLRKLLIANHSGENAGLPMVVDRGAKWLSATMSGVDSQHLEVRRFQVEEICRAMGVLPIMVGHTDKTATYASSEQMFLAHVVHTLTPLYARVEQSIDAYLIGRRDFERGFYAKFVAAGLLRGAMTDRGNYFSKALGSGGSPAWMTQDEVRALDELNPMGGEAAKLPKPTNVPAPAPKEDAAEAAKRAQLHDATIAALQREPAPAQIHLSQPIHVEPAQVKVGDVNLTVAEGAIQSATTVEPAQVKAGDVHIGESQHHITVQHPAAQKTTYKRDPKTQELTSSETRFE